MGSSVDQPREVAISVVLPCLNEEQSVGLCVATAMAAIEATGLRGEVVVVDNGSTDRSAERSREAGARVVTEARPGYGSAYLRGLSEARGSYLVMADADGTYDLTLLGAFVDALRAGNDLVMGSRFRGRIARGAMPWSHRIIGNPALTGILRLLFRVEVSDAHCGMRALTRAAFLRLGLSTLGMEFASEMVIKAGKERLRIAEIPIDYSVRTGESKLRTLRDGWRHLRFMLLLSPTVMLLAPGVALLLVGLISTLLLLPGPLWVGGRSYDVHVMILMAGVALLGAQATTLGLSARTFAVSTGLETHDALIDRLSRVFTLERGLLLGGMVFAAGFALDFSIAWNWARAGFPALHRMREAIAATLLMALGAQTMAAAFFLSMLTIRRSEVARRQADDASS